MEIRSFGGFAKPEVGDGRTVTGYAIVFNTESCTMYDPKQRCFFREIIDAGAVTDELLASSDVKALYNHDRDRLLARSVSGEGTLRLSVDERGLQYSFEVPDTATGNEVLELLRRGDLGGSSFAFTFSEKDISVEQHAETRYTVRRVNRINGLYDVSVVADPAYLEASATLRSMQSALLGGGVASDDEGVPEASSGPVVAVWEAEPDDDTPDDVPLRPTIDELTEYVQTITT